MKRKLLWRVSPMLVAIFGVWISPERVLADNCGTYEQAVTYCNTYQDECETGGHGSWQLCEQYCQGMSGQTQHCYDMTAFASCNPTYDENYDQWCVNGEYCDLMFYECSS